jgi:methionine salvage enolase-phosphatase E1
MQESTRDFLFLSDAKKEVEAARAAGMFAAVCDREATPAKRSLDTITSFDEVLPD